MGRARRRCSGISTDPLESGRSSVQRGDIQAAADVPRYPADVCVVPAGRSHCAGFAGATKSGPGELAQRCVVGGLVVRTSVS